MYINSDGEKQVLRNIISNKIKRMTVNSQWHTKGKPHSFL